MNKNFLKLVFATVFLFAGTAHAEIDTVKAEDFVKVDHLPLLGTGKLDLLALKEMVKKLEN